MTTIFGGAVWAKADVAKRQTMSSSDRRNSFVAFRLEPDFFSETVGIPAMSRRKVLVFILDFSSQFSPSGLNGFVHLFPKGKGAWNCRKSASQRRKPLSFAVIGHEARRIGLHYISPTYWIPRGCDQKRTSKTPRDSPKHYWTRDR